MCSTGSWATQHQGQREEKAGAGGILSAFSLKIDDVVLLTFQSLTMRWKSERRVTDEFTHD